MRQFLRTRLGVVVLAVLVVVLATASYIAFWPSGSERTLVAHFTRTVGIYEGSDVRVLGVKIGTITEVKPEGTTVRVSMRYDDKYDIPADAKAVVIPPSVVSDRYIQLSPVYKGGPTLADGADLPPARTVAPLELDDVYTALDNLNTALGPEGANSDGALSRLINTGAKNLDGNGANLHATLVDLADAMQTLSDGRGDLFGTVVNLQKFTTALAESDSAVREFNDQLATVSTQLAGEREELAAALRNLAVALSQVTTFVRNNRDALKSNVEALTDITGVLVRQQKALIDTLDVAPLALSNLNLAYNPRSGTLDTRDDVLGAYDPASFVCSMLVHLVPAQQVPQACFSLAQLLNKVGQPLTSELSKLLAGKIPGANLGDLLNPSGSTPNPGPSAQGGAPTSPTGEMQGSDLTLGGILRGGR